MPVASQRCPVPAEQQPINEYQAMRESWFYRWGTLSLGAFLKPVGWLWAISWAFTGPMAAASFEPAKFPIAFGLSAAMGATVLPLLALVQLYVGWVHVGRRLSDQAIPYEESGWYDGQIWVKPDEVSSRDRLIVEYQIQPVLRRLRRTFGTLSAALAVGLTVWTWL